MDAEKDVEEMSIEKQIISDRGKDTDTSNSFQNSNKRKWKITTQSSLYLLSLFCHEIFVVLPEKNMSSLHVLLHSNLTVFIGDTPWFITQSPM